MRFKTNRIAIVMLLFLFAIASHKAEAQKRLTNSNAYVTPANANRSSSAPSITADGRIIAFTSNADFFLEGRPKKNEIWLLDTATDELEALTDVRLSLNWESSNVGSFAPRITPDGNYIFFRSDVDFNHEGRKISDIWMIDRTNNNELKKIIGINATSGSEHIRSYSISLTGERMALSSARNFLDEPGNTGEEEIWIWDKNLAENPLESPFFRLIDLEIVENLEGDSTLPEISANGDWVVFDSRRDFLNQGIDTNNVWLANVDTGSLQNLTKINNDFSCQNQSNLFADAPVINSDGTLVIFHSNVDFDSSSQYCGDHDLWAWNAATDEVTRLTDAMSSPGDLRGCFNPFISRDSKWVGFISTADLLQEGRPNGISEVWLKNLENDNFYSITDIWGIEGSAPPFFGGHSVFLNHDASHIVISSPDQLSGSDFVAGPELWLSINPEFVESGFVAR